MMEGPLNNQFPNKISDKKETAESVVEEKKFNQYIQDLKLKPEDLKKIILDVGAGEAYFAKRGKDKNITSQIYSLEPFQEMSVKEKVLVSLAENISMPDNFFDLIVSDGAVPNIYLGGYNVKEKVKKSFSEMLRVLKGGGEIRLARVLIGRKYQRQMVLTDSIEESLEELKKTYNFEVDKIRTPQNDTYEYDDNNNKKDLLAESFLIILKKNVGQQEERY